MKALAALMIIGLAAGTSHAQAPPPPPPELPWLKDALIGFEPGPFDPAETPGETWYHQNALQINGSELSLYKAPVFCRNGKLYRSSSDGGFLRYKGTISGQTATLTLEDCHYCAVPKDKSSPFFRRTLPISLPSQDTVKLGDVLYRRGVSPHTDRCPADA